MTDVDVAITGGGPAGCAAALTLLRYTRRKVAVLERSQYHSYRVGETVSAALGPLLGYLGVGGLLESQGHLPAHGTEAAWGQAELLSRDFLFTGHGQGWHLDRLAFDRALAAAVGGNLHRGVSVRAAVRDGEYWRLDTGGDVIVARQVIDATGRPAAFARLAGAVRHRSDRLIGVGCVLELAADASIRHTVLIEATAQGWWYSAPIPGRRLIVVCMTDADLLTPEAISAPVWEAALAQAPHTAERRDRATRIGSPRAWPAGSDTLSPPLGEGWVAAGDAAASFDPLSSLGVGHAVASGIQAARIVENRLMGDDALAEVYPDDLARHRAAYMARRAAFYAAETRFPDAPFWRRRQLP
jgi:flavin-dependent dehydrogenase